MILVGRNHSTSTIYVISHARKFVTDIIEKFL
jgi:hypothetical protein